MSTITRSDAVEIFADVVPGSAPALRRVAVEIIEISGWEKPADPFDFLATKPRTEASRIVVAALARARGEKVCDRCAGTGQYGHYGVCFDCAGRRTVADV